MIYNNAIELIGKTPLLRVNNILKTENVSGEIFVKLEKNNPGGSVKDRIALSMIEDAESKGVLQPGGVIIEPTSGNTGVGLAWIGAQKGYKVYIAMPESMSEERKKLLKAYGAHLVLTPAAEGMKGAMKKASELKEQLNGVILSQFSNPANPSKHFFTTAEEIWKDTEGKIDIFIAGVGTGGTISGVGKKLKEKNPSIQIIAVEPTTSAVLSGEQPGQHRIQGIGAGFIPENYDAAVVDRIIKISSEEAIEKMKKLATQEGLLVGISSGAAFAAALTVAKETENTDKRIVVLLPDTGERYLSLDVF